MTLQSITLFTNNLNELEEFYRKNLELPVDRLSENELLIKAGDTDLYFELSAVKTEPAHIAFNIPCNQLAYAIRWLRGRVNLLPVSAGNYIAEFPAWNARSVYFRDSAGNILEIIARENLNNIGESGFSSGSILNISELGVVVPSAGEFAGILNEKTGLPYFPDETPSAGSFVVLGDDNGLFIVVQEGRPWHPTQITANRNSLRAEFNTAGNTFLLKSFNSVPEIIKL